MMGRKKRQRVIKWGVRKTHSMIDYELFVEPSLVYGYISISKTAMGSLMDDLHWDLSSGSETLLIPLAAFNTISYNILLDCP